MLSVPSAANTVAPESAPVATPERPAFARRKLWFFTVLAMLAGVAGARLLSTTEHGLPEVRSGSPGYRQAKNGQRQHWHRRALTVYLDDSLQRVGPQASDAVMQAFGRWAESDQRLPDLVFDTGKTRSTPTQDGMSTISYGLIDIPGHERDLAITVTYAKQDSGEILEADIVLNALYPMGVLTANTQQVNSTAGQDGGNRRAGDGNRHAGDGDRDSDSNRDSGSRRTRGEDEAVDCQNRYDVQNVTTHEAGHFFGLGEDAVERGSTMFQAIDQCETHKRALSSTDVGAVSTLYADSAAPEEVAAGPPACSFAAPARSGGAAWLLGLLGGLSIRRRRRAAGRC